MENRVVRIIRAKWRFMIPMLVLVLIFYFMLPISLAFFPDVMNQTSFIPGVSWAWLYAFLQIPMTWIVGFIYHVKAKKFDQQIEEWKREDIS